MRDKSGSNIRYAVQVAIPFLPQPFQRPLSKRLKFLPDNMNETYNQHIRQLAPKYRQLLKTALIWTLLADGVVATVSEIMDVYSGIYLESNDSNFVSVSADDQKLLVAQLREVSGPFLEIRDGGMDHIVTLRDRIGIWEYYFDSDNRVSDCSTPAQEFVRDAQPNCIQDRLLPFSEERLATETGYCLL